MDRILFGSFLHSEGSFYEHSNEIRDFVVHLRLLNVCLVQGFGLQRCDVLCVWISLFTFHCMACYCLLMGHGVCIETRSECTQPSAYFMRAALGHLVRSLFWTAAILNQGM
jgi:hypothetical protein